MVKPISPSEIRLVNTIPDEVIEVFNILIARNFNGRSATVSQKEAVALIASKMNVDKGVIEKKKWLDVESLFEREGWDVDYDSPGFNESYDATFKFTRKLVKRMKANNE